jgi:adenylate cyclase
MSITASELVRRWAPNWRQLARLQRSGPLRAFLGANLIAVAVILIHSQGWLQPAELVIYDAFRVAWAGEEVNSRILLVSVSEGDIKRLRDKWPLSDGDLAELLNRIAGWKPRVIAVDIYRDFPRRPGSEQLTQTLAQHPNILWGFTLGDEDHQGIPPPRQLAGTDRAVLADIVTDPGRVVRRGLLFADDGKDQFTAMGMALALGYLAPEGIALQPGPHDSLLLGKAVIAPLDESRGPFMRVDSRGYQMLIDYHGGVDPFVTKSVDDIMGSDDAAALVHDKVVIVGGAAESVPDSFPTPFSTGFNTEDPVYGSSLHAHIADQLIRGALDGTPSLSGLSRPLEDVWIWLWTLAGLGLGLAIRSTVPAVGGGFVGVLVIGGIVYVAFGKALLLPALPAALAWLGSGVLTNQLLHAAANRARTQLRRSFEHYLPPALISDMLKSGDLPKLGGERRELSVVFSDIAASTTLAETVDPVDLAPLMNAYFAGVGAAIFKEGGYINEFMGDGVLSFFGAPQRQSDHADRAVAAALQIAAFGDRYSRELHERGIPFGHTRVGVHCGDAIVGNIGVPSRLKYSALGDVLNTGSRLEGLNKVVGTRVAVSDEILKRCQRSRFRPMGDFVVKGRRGATPVFEPVDSQRYSDDHIARYLAAYEAMQAERPEAIDLFAELLREDPDDPCLKFHHARLISGETGSLIVMTEK